MIYYVCIGRNVTVGRLGTEVSSSLLLILKKTPQFNISVCISNSICELLCFFIALEKIISVSVFACLLYICPVCLLLYLQSMATILSKDRKNAKYNASPRHEVTQRTTRSAALVGQHKWHRKVPMTTRPHTLHPTKPSQASPPHWGWVQE